MAGLKALVSGIEDGGNGLIKGGKRRRRRAWLRCGRKKTTGGGLGCDGGLGRPGGRGPVGRGGKISRLEKKMGRGWAERPDGPKAEENYF
jgi:hypothetical protein